MSKHDWSALIELVRDNEGGRFWVDALQVAIDGRDPSMLADMLARGMTPPAALLPTLADVIRDGSQPQRSGRPSAFTEGQARMLNGAMGALRNEGRTLEEARIELAEFFDVSPDTIRRTIRRIS